MRLPFTPLGLAFAVSLACAALPAAAYQVIAKSSGKLMDASGSQTVNGTPIIQYSNVGSSNQQWKIEPVTIGGETFYRFFSQIATDKVLNVEGASNAAYAKMILYSKSDADNELWKIVPRDDGFQIISKKSSLCLDVNGGPNAVADGIQLIQYPCNGLTNQTWKIPGFSLIGPAKIITSAASKLVLDVDRATNKVNQWSINNGLNQQWKFVPSGDYFYKLVSASDDKQALDIAEGKDPFGNVRYVTQLKPLASTDTQRWWLTDKGNGLTEIGNIATGTCLDVPGLLGTVGVQMNLYSCNGATNQRWTLTSVGTASTPASNAPPPVTTTKVANKKGVGTWEVAEWDPEHAVRAYTIPAMKKLNAKWYYNWNAKPPISIVPDANFEFVPIVWGLHRDDKGNRKDPEEINKDLALVKSAGYKTVLGFNEPDNCHDQSCMTVDEAIEQWPKLMALGDNVRLGSPAPTGVDLSNSGDWLINFMKKAEDKQYRVDFIALHYYVSGDAGVEQEVTGMKKFLEEMWAKYHKPIWVTEYALINWWVDDAHQPNSVQQAAFAEQASTMMNNLDFVERFAWFALPQFDPNSINTTGLIKNMDGKLLPTGEAYARVAPAGPGEPKK